LISEITANEQKKPQFLYTSQHCYMILEALRDALYKSTTTTLSHILIMLGGQPTYANK